MLASSGRSACGGGHEHEGRVVEGGEAGVFCGGRRTIERTTPDIVMDVTVDRHEPQHGVRWLVDHGYRAFDLTPAGPRPIAIQSLAPMSNLRRSTAQRYGEVLLSARSDSSIAALSQRVAGLGWPS